MYLSFPKLNENDEEGRELAKRLALRDYTIPDSFYHRSIHLFCPRIESSKCKVAPSAHLWTDSPSYLEPSK